VECAGTVFGDGVHDLELFGWHPVAASPASPVVHLKNVQDALLHGCYRPPGATAFVRVEGKDRLSACNHLAAAGVWVG
jgi:hypothetical protein